MWYRRLVPLLAVALLAACAEPSEEAAPDTGTAAPEAALSDQEAIEAVADYWQTHFNMQHPDMVASVYVDSAWVTPAGGGLFEGRDAVQGWLAEATAAAPTIEIRTADVVASGDWAMGLGTYSMSVPVEGAEPMGYSGSYVNLMEKSDGEWKILGTLSNYDATPPDDWAWDPAPEGDPPPDAPANPALIEAYEAAWNAGDAAAVAALYADDARAAFADGPLLEGPAAVEAAMAERMIDGATLEIHELGNQEMGDGLSGAGGWYAITAPDGTTAQTGFWMNLLRARADGSQEIVWTVSNARPGGM